MHKRTKGYTLLLLLVLTGLAGRQSTTTITSKERRFLIEELKESKSAVQKSVKGLTDKQLNFKANAKNWSIKECLQHIALAENNLWNIVDANLKKSPNPEKKADIQVKDADILTLLTEGGKKLEAPENFKPGKATWKTTEETLDAFKDKRTSLIKYAKTSTADMRNYVLQMPIGNIDAYQMLLYISAHTKRHTMQIEEIKANPAFPK
jgi:DinB superfamily